MTKMEGFSRGINLGGWLSQCDERSERYYDSFITAGDIRRIAEMDLIEDEEGKPLEKGYAHIDDCMDWCEANGLHAVIDLHKTYGYSFDPLEKNDDKEIFFRDAALQERFIALWRRIALRYRGRSFAALELLNEVVPMNVADSWNGIVFRTIETLREITPDQWIIVGGVCYNSVDSVPKLDVPHDGRVAYNFHCYEPLIFTHQRAYWVKNMPKDLRVHYPDDPARLAELSRGLSKELARAAESMVGTPLGVGYFETLFRPALEAAEKTGAPLYCGEYGVIDQAEPEDALKWIRDINTVFDRHGIGRALWNYKRKDFGVVDPHYDGVRDELIGILAGKQLAV